VASGYFDGMTLLVGRGEQILHRAVFGNGAPGRVLHVASTGKWVAAATIAAVVDEGGLAWTDTAQSILPELRGDKGRATLRQLLSHTAGYPDYQPAGRQRDHYATLEQSVAQLRDLPAASAPGVEFRYGGLAMQVAGRMAEVAAGLAFNEIFLRRIAAPLGMTASGFSPVSAEPGFSPMLGGGMFTSADDYARFLMMYSRAGWYRGRRVLSATGVAELRADQVGNARVESGEFVEAARQDLRRDVYGLGVWREECDTQGTATLISSPGWAGAYAWYDRLADVWGVVIAKANVDCATRDGYNSFLGSAIYAPMARAAVLEASGSNVKRGVVAVGGGRLYHEESGDGTPVVLVHDYSLDRRQWDPQVKLLQQRYRVICVDLRGCGRSGPPAGRQRARHAEDLVQVLDALDITQAHLVGSSLGCIVVAEVLALYPQRVLSAVMAGSYPPDGSSSDWLWSPDALPARRAGNADTEALDSFHVRQRRLEQMLHGSGSGRERLRQPLWRMISEWQLCQPLRDDRWFQRDAELRKKIASMAHNSRVLIIRGDRESASCQWKDLFSTAKCHVFADCGHWPNMERPDMFMAVLEDWLSDT
jgi:pimeloyl-ACP methyl ester carboxylesterase/CubicO group peptidase (beta-lactamase class C family)